MVVVTATLFIWSYQPPANNTFLSEQTSHQQSVSGIFFSQNKSAPATSQMNMLCNVSLLP
jgi:hypothetical protein